jgi:ribose/xylose/arabinose/galactoside ABC-type transport system permease subunit
MAQLSPRIPRGRLFWRRGETTYRVETITNNILLVALVALCTFFALQTDAFLTRSNFLTILDNYAALGVVAVALAMLVIAGHVDLSIGSTAGFSALIAALAVTDWGFPTGLAFVVGIAAGAGVGLINGTLCAGLEFNPIIVTLGMLGALRGITLLIHQDQVFGLGGWFRTVGAGDVGGIPNTFWFVAGAFAVGTAFVVLTPWGRHIYAIGINPTAAYLSGLPVKLLPFWLYVAVGASAGVAGVLVTARLDGVAPGQQGLQLELQALTVILLGGVAFAGGRGRLVGVLFAWLFLGALANGLVLMNVTPYVQLLAAGLALVFAAALDGFGSALNARLQRRRRLTQQLNITPQAATTSSEQRSCVPISPDASKRRSR